MLEKLGVMKMSKLLSEKQCPECGSKFEPPLHCPSKRFCSTYCRTKYHRRKSDERKLAYHLSRSVDL